jgi:LEA14-like dessication related protein
MLKANAILYNPNNVKMKLRKIDIEVFVDGKPSAIIDQTLNMIIPANSEFTVPLEVKLNLKKMGFLDTVFGVIGGKKFKIRYKGNIKITYKALPLRVPVDYEDEVRIRL